MQPSSSISPFSNALANAKMHFDLAAITPSSLMFLLLHFPKETILSGWGKCMCQTFNSCFYGRSAETCNPSGPIHSAAFTVICCPKMAHASLFQKRQSIRARAKPGNILGLIPFGACKFPIQFLNHNTSQTSALHEFKTCESTGTKVSLNVTRMCFSDYPLPEISAATALHFCQAGAPFSYIFTRYFSTPEIALRKKFQKFLSNSR